jgi:hypothetical protein
MPPLIGALAFLPAWLGAAAPAIGAIGGAASLGETIANIGGGKPNAAAPSTPAPTPPDAQQLLQQKALVSQQLPNVIGATSGLANPDYDSLVAQILSGVVGQPGANAAGKAATGDTFTPSNQQPTNAAVNGTDVNLSSFLNNFS